MEDVSRHIWLNLSCIVAFIIFNGFFAASEIAIISVNKNKVEIKATQGDKKSKYILNLINEPSKFLSTIQVGVILSEFFIGAFGAINFTNVLANVFQNSNIEFIQCFSTQIAFIAIIFISGFVTFIFGKLVPKKIAMDCPEKIAYIIIKPLWVLYKISMPLVNIFSGFTNLIVSRFEKKYAVSEKDISEEEIRMMISASEKDGGMNSLERDMIHGVFKFNTTIAREVMTPRTSVVAMDINEPMEKILDIFIKEKISRIPIYEDDIDNIIGILHIKDLIVDVKNIDKLKVKDVLRKAYLVPETKNINVLFKELQQSKNHMAILFDEYGGFTGILTINDLMEEIMGAIHDEHDDDENEIEKIDNKTYMVDGLLTINDLNESLNLDIPSDDYDTVGGFVISLLGKIPKDNEQYVLEFKNLVFETKAIKEKRIEKVKLYIAS